MKVYGIKNCDTVKKALKWLDDHQVSYEFHDFKKFGVSEEKLEEWSAQTGWEPLLNKRGTTWKKLGPEVQNQIQNKADAFKLMQEKTSIIKRPVIEGANNIILGFDEAAYAGFIA
ncbi:ArsC family reductase [Paradesertivirga mongoliensis]|uniref:ArsC family reductase n=1 Tax=Paradesertivirga mongoliensis TaxID=2100740 RepID=A0ABW4ZLJ3_9SPHI|nr:ArsC family reductase [Pedobacter mongoliensis]